MRKLLLFMVFVIAISNGSVAQQIKKVQLIRSDLQKGFVKEGYTRIIGPIFSHENSTLAADSANFNQSQNTFEAFGNVVITQSNGTNVYADHLNYDGNTRLALLTRNVRLVDGTATLTTDYLTYNMGTRIGTYTGGGKIVNGDDVLTSKNGYYFATSNDAYFRYDVVVNTPGATIKTDTLKYNSVSKIAHFYGPTNIFGKKDSTRLYTENGTYNTVTEQARFGKKNLYTQGSKSLKGDSLFYDGKAGYGRAINRITFIDTAQKVMLKGDLGLYKKSDESALVTKNAHVIFTTEDNGKVDSIYMAADTLYTRLIQMKDFKPIAYPEFGKDSVETDSVKKPAASAIASGDSISSPDTSVKQQAIASAGRPADVKQEKKKRGIKGLFAKKAASAKDKADAPVKLNNDSLRITKNSGLADTVQIKNKGDTLQVTAAGKRDTSLKAAAPEKKLSTDSTRVVLSKADSLRLQDTTKTRIILAYRKVKVFKSDLQAKADSIFYSYADSTMRCFVDPMIWAEGTQLSADTVYMQLKNRKMDNILLRHKGFIVNTEADSARFNQIKGKTITGVFRESKIDRLFVDGNAESIYFTREDSAYSGMNYLVSSRMRITFEDNKVADIFPIKKPEGMYYPMEDIPKDKEVLDGFIWKPKDRPRSKEEIIPSLQDIPKKETKPPAKPAIATQKKDPDKKAPNPLSEKKPAP